MREFSESQRKRLLAFITGSDRIPLGGLSKLKLIIVKNGPDSDRYVVLFLGESLKMICGVVDPLFEQPETVTYRTTRHSLFARGDTKDSWTVRYFPYLFPYR